MALVPISGLAFWLMFFAGWLIMVSTVDDSKGCGCFLGLVGLFLFLVGCALA